MDGWENGGRLLRPNLSLRLLLEKLTEGRLLLHTSPATADVMLSFFCSFSLSMSMGPRFPLPKMPRTVPWPQLPGSHQSHDSEKEARYAE